MIRPKRNKPSVPARRQTHIHPGWSPARLPGLWAYWDSTIADSLIMSVSGTDLAVQQWQDRSAHQHNYVTASADTNRPLWQNVGLGTGPCLVADGIDDHLHSKTPGFDRGSDWGRFSVYWVGHAITFEDEDTIWTYDNVLRWHEHTAGFWHMNGYETGNTLSTTQIFTASLWGAEHDGTNVSIWRNLNQEATTPDSGSLADRLEFVFFGKTNGANAAHAKIGAMWVLDRPLSERDRQLLLEYCQQKGWLPGWTFTQAESATILPNTSIWISQEGITTADAGTTVDQWDSSYGGVTCSLVAPTTAERPTYTAGTYPILTFDGVGQRMSGSTGLYLGSDHTENQWGWVGQRIALTTLGYPYVAYASRYALADRTANVMYASLGNGSLLNLDDPDGNNQHWWAMRSQADGMGYIGHANITEASVSASIATYTDGQTPYIGGNSAGTGFTNIQMRAVYWSQGLTDYQKAYLRALLTIKTGLAC